MMWTSLLIETQTGHPVTYLQVSAGLGAQPVELHVFLWCIPGWRS